MATERLNLSLPLSYDEQELGSLAIPITLPLEQREQIWYSFQVTALTSFEKRFLSEYNLN